MAGWRQCAELLEDEIALKNGWQKGAESGERMTDGKGRRRWETGEKINQGYPDAEG